MEYAKWLLFLIADLDCVEAQEKHLRNEDYVTVYPKGQVRGGEGQRVSSTTT